MLRHKGVEGVFGFELVCVYVTPICLIDSWLFTFHYTIEKLCQELFGTPTNQSGQNVHCCHVEQRKLFVNIKLSTLYVKILLTGPEDCLFLPQSCLEHISGADCASNSGRGCPTCASRHVLAECSTFPPSHTLLFFHKLLLRLESWHRMTLPTRPCGW